MNKVVEQIIKKELFKRGGVMASREAVEAAYRELAAKMKPLGLDINLIKSKEDYNRALAFVKNLEDQIFKKSVTDSGKSSAEIFDLDKNKLDPKKPILGGTQSEEDILQKSIKKNIAAATKKGDFRGIANQVLRNPEIAREFALMKRFPFDRDLNVRSGADAIPLSRKAEFDEQMKKLNVSATPGKDREGTVGEFVQEMKRFKIPDKDIQMMLSSGKSSQVPYVMEQYGLSASDVVNILKRGDPLIEGMATGGRAGFRVGKKVVEKIIKPEKTLKSVEKKGIIDLSDPKVAEEFAKYMKQMDPELDAKMQQIADDINQRIELKNFKTKGRKENSEGGRAGFKVGSPSKRKFLGIMGSLAATIAAIKSGLIGAGGKETTKQVVKESVKDVANAPPSYFFDLANKIKLLGKESKVKPQERVNEYNYKGKDGSDYTLTEDISTGDMQITKDKGGMGFADDKAFDTIDDRTVMEYRAPRKDADPDTQKTISEGAEYDEFKVEFDMDGTPADADEISDIIKKEIIEEASEIPERKIKRAGGGVAYMLGE